jgi:two-component system, response regulator PdtaR
MANASTAPARTLPSRLSDLTQMLLSPDGEGASGNASTPVKILVVEDDHFIAFELETALIDAGYEVSGVAATAETALEMARETPPALAIMDIRLAGRKDGVDAALELFETLGIRCIFASAHQDDAIRKRAFPARPIAWLGKPYSMQAVVAEVGRALKELRRS